RPYAARHDSSSAAPQQPVRVSGDAPPPCAGGRGARRGGRGPADHARLRAAFGPVRARDLCDDLRAAEGRRVGPRRERRIGSVLRWRGIRPRDGRAAAHEGHRREQLRGAVRIGRRRRARRALRDRQPDQRRCGRQHTMGKSTARAAGDDGAHGADTGMAVMPAHGGAHLDEVYPTLPFTPVKGQGPWLEDADGRKVLDFYGGHAVAALGYGHPRLTEAICRQAQTLHFQSNILPLAVRHEAAEKLARFAPDGLDRVFFVNSGAEANENALRVALTVTGRSKIVAVEHGFHGRTAAAGAVTWGAKKWYGFPRAPFDVVFVPRNDVAAMHAAVDEKTAAVIVEPVQGLAGAFDL